jgi:DNA polymerase III gamma/tau subunit
MIDIDRVLALSMRPKFLEACVGQAELIQTLQTQFSTGRVPHFFIIHGAIGSGKTTLARILALALQVGKLELTDQDWSLYKKYDIKEINAANQNGVDDIRQIVESMKYQPMLPSKVRVVCLDEAHQLTSAAQNALITETEDVGRFVYYIFCTSTLSKIIPALQRRAYMISPKPLLEDDVLTLLKTAAEFINYKDDIDPLYQALNLSSITSPGLILQAAEKYFSGIPANESIYNCESCKVDTMAICRTVGAGNWKDTANLIKFITKSDINMVKNCIIGYLKTILLASNGSKALVVAKAIRIIAEEGSNEFLPVFFANVCVACEHIRSAK